MDILLKGLSYYRKDTLIDTYAKSLSQLSPKQLINLSKQRYQGKDKFIATYAAKLNTLTVSEAVGIAKNLGNYSKDEFLLKAIEKVTDLTKNNLAAYAKAAYRKEAEILKKGLKYLK